MRPTVLKAIEIVQSAPFSPLISILTLLEDLSHEAQYSTKSSIGVVFVALCICFELLHSFSLPADASVALRSFHSTIVSSFSSRFFSEESAFQRFQSPDPALWSGGLSVVSHAINSPFRVCATAAVLVRTSQKKDTH